MPCPSISWDNMMRGGLTWTPSWTMAHLLGHPQNMSDRQGPASRSETMLHINICFHNKSCCNELLPFCLPNLDRLEGVLQILCPWRRCMLVEKHAISLAS